MSLPSDISVVLGSDASFLPGPTMQGLTDLPCCSSFISCHSLPQQKCLLLSGPWLGLTCSVSGPLHWLFLQPDSPVADSLSFRSLVQCHKLSGSSPNNLNNFILVPNPLCSCRIVFLASSYQKWPYVYVLLVLAPRLTSHQQSPKECLTRSRCSINIC